MDIPLLLRHTHTYSFSVDELCFPCNIPVYILLLGGLVISHQNRNIPMTTLSGVDGPRKPPYPVSIHIFQKVYIHILYVYIYIYKYSLFSKFSFDISPPEYLLIYLPLYPQYIPMYLPIYPAIFPSIFLQSGIS